jgi:hypothetical protein
MTPEQLKELAHELKFQDNRITSFPLYVVQQTRRILGMDTDYCDQIAYVWKDDPEYIWFTEEEAMKEVLNSGYKDEEFDNVIVETGYIDIWEMVSVHLTEKAAQLYIDQNSHNLRSPRIYVSSQYRCHEFNNVIEYLKGLDK